MLSREKSPWRGLRQFPAAPTLLQAGVDTCSHTTDTSTTTETQTWTISSSLNGTAAQHTPREGQGTLVTAPEGTLGLLLAQGGP